LNEDQDTEAEFNNTLRIDQVINLPEPSLVVIKVFSTPKELISLYPREKLSLQSSQELGHINTV